MREGPFKIVESKSPFELLFLLLLRLLLFLWWCCLWWKVRATQMMLFYVSIKIHKSTVQNISISCMCMVLRVCLPASELNIFFFFFWFCFFVSFVFKLKAHSVFCVLKLYICFYPFHFRANQRKKNHQNRKPYDIFILYFGLCLSFCTVCGFPFYFKYILPRDFVQDLIFVLFIKNYFQCMTSCAALHSFDCIIQRFTQFAEKRNCRAKMSATFHKSIASLIIFRKKPILLPQHCSI